jgi:hypothetical protein
MVKKITVGYARAVTLLAKMVLKPWDGFESASEAIWDV